MTPLATMALGWKRARTTDSTDASFPTRGAQLFGDFVPAAGGAAAQTTRALFPLNAGWRGEPGSAGGKTNNVVAVRPYGTGNENDTFKMRVYGWSLLDEGDRATAQFEETLLCELLCTLSAKTGVAGGIVGTGKRYVDTITITYGNSGVGLEAFSPGNDLAAHAVIDMKGSAFVEFTFDRNSSATACNSLWRQY